MRNGKRIILAVLILAAAVLLSAGTAFASGFEEIGETEEFSAVTITYVAGFWSDNYRPRARIEIVDPDKNVVVYESFKYDKIGDRCSLVFVPEKAGEYSMRGYCYIRTSYGESITTSIQYATLRVNHHWADEVVLAEPTCLEEGQLQHTCTLCGTTRTDAIPVLEHVWGEWEVTREATFKTEGEEKRTCPACGGEESRALDVLAREAGMELSDGKGKYTLLKDLRTVAFAAPQDPEIQKATVPATVTLAEDKFRVVQISAEAFSGCAGLESVAVGRYVAEIGAKAFSGCVKLKKVTGMKAVAAIGKNAFENCRALEKFTVPAAVEKIGAKAFFNCVNLKAVSGGEAVQAIGDYAFSGCKKLAEYTVPEKVKKIGAKAFWNCSGLKVITIRSTKLTDRNVGKDAFGKIYKKAKVKCPAKKLKEYRKWLPKKGLPAKASIE